MISIIIPVLSKDEYYTQDILKQIKEKIKEEHEVIILDGPEGVNEKWNKGVEQAKGEYVWIINNDIVILDGLDKQLLEVLKTRKIACPISTTRKYKWQMPAIAPKDNLVGWCFMLKKQDYPIIPKELDIWYGDDWCYNKLNKDVGYAGIIHHFESKSINNPEVKDNILERIELDKINWLELKKKLGAI